VRCLTAVALSMLFLAGCAGNHASVAKNYYVLGLEDTPTVERYSDIGPGMIITRVTLADYLNEQGIAMILSESRVNIARNSLWAEPLHRTIPRLLADDLRHSCTCPVRLGASSAGSDAGIGNLTIRIDRFGPTDKGLVVLTGEIGFSGKGAETSSRLFHLSKELTGDGYAAAVRDMRELLSDLATLIAAQRHS
jgi:Uncharacterized protein conserved in bacteria